MNCDEAFDVLTQPNSSRRQELLWHLDLCPRCRDLQKVLEPALAMFETSGPAPSGSQQDSSATFPTRQALNSESSRLPILSDEALDLAEQAAANWTNARAKRMWRRLSLVAATACCLFLGVHSWMTRKPDFGTNPASPEAATVSPNSCLWVAQDNDTAVPKGMSNHEIILSCVACHLQSDGAL